MTVQMLRTVDEINLVAPAWQRLADLCGGRATSQPWWCMAWWSHLGSGRPLVVAVRRDGELVALAPLHERRIGGLLIVRFLGHGLGAVSEMLLAPGEERAGVEAWSAVLGGASRHLDLIEYREAAGGIASLRMTGAHMEIKTSDTCPVARLEGTLAQYLAGRPKGLRRTLRRADERLGAEGGHHDVEMITEPSRLNQVLDEVVAIYDAAEGERPRQHLLAPPWASFTRDVLHRASALGRLRLFVGRINGQPVSFDVGFVAPERLELWLGRYDPQFRRFSPGHLSMRAAAQHAVGASWREIDMGLGDDRYKRLWCDGAYPTLNLTAASSRLVLFTGKAILSARRSLRRTGGPFAARRTVAR